MPLEDDIAFLEAVPTLALLFHKPVPAPAWGKASHDFLLSGEAMLRDVAGLYGTRDLTAAQAAMTLEAAMQAAFTSPPVEGDTVEIGGLALTVTRMDGPRIIQVGLLLPRAARGAVAQQD